MSKPIIGISCCTKTVENQNAQSVHQKYINCVNDHGAVPILLPTALAELSNFEQIVPMLDGILLTGSYSNVAPERYGASHEENYTDLNRDQLSFQLIDYAKNNNLPVLAICRGLQEMNVALGGSLHPDYREAGYTEPHLPDSSLPIAEQYLPAHDIYIDKESQLAKFNHKVWKVNSLHKQCINQLGKDVTIMAKAPDGLIEAISYNNHPYFIGVQWHPEASHLDDDLSVYLFKDFVKHAQQYRQQKAS
ncbi:MAG: gamma-glutamyl-gamma-aminobutyrate hydrolase [Gammaproteobacteria bacterium]|nr:MAG: gamma-glutamyl-gamma-aminobutyrate hydrolase [Gammaproteobacteria bacterium]